MSLQFRMWNTWLVRRRLVLVHKAYIVTPHKITYILTHYTDSTQASHLIGLVSLIHLGCELIMMCHVYYCILCTISDHICLFFVPALYSTL